MLLALDSGPTRVYSAFSDPTFLFSLTLGSILYSFLFSLFFVGIYLLVRKRLKISFAAFLSVAVVTLAIVRLLIFRKTISDLSILQLGSCAVSSNGQLTFCGEMYMQHFCISLLVSGTAASAVAFKISKREV